MRLLKLISVLGALAIVISAFAASGSTFAALPEILGSGNFAFTSGASELIDRTTLLAVKCKADKGTGTINNVSLITVTVDFEKCTINGLAAQSLGDKSGVILLPNLPGKVCYISAGTKDVGILFTLPTEGVHIEAPSLGQLLVVTGTVVGLIEPVNTSAAIATLGIKGSKSCEGTTDRLLLELEHSGETLEVEKVSTESLTFEKTVEVMA